MADRPDTRTDSSEALSSAAAAVRAALRLDAVREEHPSSLQIGAYVDGTLETTEREMIDAHLEICATCREDVADLRVLAVPAIARTGRQVWRWYVAAGLAAAAVLAGVMVWTRSVAPAAVVLTLKDGAHTVTVDADGRIAGVPAMGTADRDVVIAALRTSRLEVPATIVALRGHTGALLGPPAVRAGFQPVSPIATAVASDRPVFTWTALPRATAYVVAVFDADLRKIVESDPGTALEWTPPSALPRNTTYTWQVRAHTASGDLIAPRPPAPEARFRVLSQSDADRVTTLRRTAAGSPLTLGILLARLGLIDDATRELERVASDNPSSAVARELLVSLHAPSPTTRNPAQ